MMESNWLESLMATIDARDTPGFAAFLAPDCQFRFGNGPTIAGREQIAEFVGGFFQAIAALTHQIQAAWEVPGGKVCHGQVSYTRHDGTTLSVPFANVFGLGEQGIEEYLIFADTSALFPAAT